MIFDDSKLAQGLDETPMVFWRDSGQRVQQQMIAPINALATACQAAGFDLALASGYRSFERQRLIWNAKACGERPLLDSNEQPLVAAELDEPARMWAILRWSALPGTSRHHWGTDVDVYDRAALPANYAVQLTRAETEPGGPFAAFHQWLTAYLASPHNPGFFRPYARDCGGVAPEPWHLSYRPLARPLAAQVNCASLQPLLANTDLALKAPVLANLSAIVERYVRVPDDNA